MFTGVDEDRPRRAVVRERVDGRLDGGELAAQRTRASHDDSTCGRGRTGGTLFKFDWRSRAA